MELSLKLAIYFLIISSELDFIFSRPPPGEICNFERNGITPILRKSKRKVRQVVQPTWLSNGGFFPVDTKVRVTEENLKETAEIRKSIQKAIDSNTYAVDESNSKPVIPVVETSETPHRPQSIFPPFDFTKFDFSQWNIKNIFTSEQQNTFNQRWRRVWQDFIDNSKKWLNFNNT